MPQPAPLNISHAEQGTKFHRGNVAAADLADVTDSVSIAKVLESSFSSLPAGGPPISCVC